MSSAEAGNYGSYMIIPRSSPHLPSSGQARTVAEFPCAARCGCIFSEENLIIYLPENLVNLSNNPVNLSIFIEIIICIKWIFIISE